MRRRVVCLLVTGILVLGLPIMGSAQEQKRMQSQERERQEIQEQDQERVYGWQLMSKEERQRYRERLRHAGPPEERARIRQEHHERMKERAREQGITLPEKPGAYRKGLGPGGFSRSSGKRGGS